MLCLVEADARVPGVQIERIRFYASLLPLITAVTFGGIVGAATSGPLRLTAIVVSVVGAGFGVVRSWRIDFRADRRGVVACNFWRTYRFSWSDVELVRLAYLRVGVVPQTAFAFWVRGRRPVLVQATPLGRAAQQEAFDAIARLALPGTPVGPDVRRGNRR
jgi:hypothetical protein